jgi:hypothetical protein
MSTNFSPKTNRSASWLILLTALLLPALACNLFRDKEEAPWVPENPRQYTAETTAVEVYVLLDREGSVVDFGGPYAYGASARMRYVLRFWDVGGLMPGEYANATISKVYAPFEITGIQQDLEKDLSEAEKTEIYARATFPATEIKWADLEFSGGPEGYFLGTNSETGKEIWGYMDWREKEWEMHIVFTRDIQQDYLVQGEEPFYNWP